jgi:hypothetical protein
MNSFKKTTLGMARLQRAQKILMGWRFGAEQDLAVPHRAKRF